MRRKALRAAFSNTLIIPGLLNGKGARSPKCCDRGIMRRSPPGAKRRRETETRLRRPDLIERHGDARRPPPSGAQARRTRTNEMNLIQQLEAEADREFQVGQDHSRIPPGRHAARRRQGRRGRAHPHPEFRRRLHRPRQSGPRQLLHRPQDQLRRGRRARLPALFAQRRIRSRSSAAAPSAARSSIICAAAPASRPASPSAATRATSTRPRPPPGARDRDRRGLSHPPPVIPAKAGISWRTGTEPRRSAPCEPSRRSRLSPG